MSRVGTLVKRAQAYEGQRFNQPRLFVPAGCIVPQTAKDTMARQLYQAGVITKDDYEKMLGVIYDTQIKDPVDERFDDEAFSAWEEEFEMSKLAYYDDYGDMEQNSEQRGAPATPAPQDGASPARDRTDETQRADDSEREVDKSGEADNSSRET